MSLHIILSPGLEKPLSKIELSAANILLDYFQANVEFIPRGAGRTADFKIGRTIWELKSPTGDSKHTMEHQFSRANKQSVNLILDARRSKMTMAKFRSQAKYQFGQSKVIKRLLIINKQSKIEEIKK